MTPVELNELYRTYGPAVRARCRSICGNHADADEALQETFVKAWRKRASFDGRHPLAWLMTIARTPSLDVLRRRRPWQHDPHLWLEQPAPSQNRDATVDATRLLDEFGAEDAALLRLRYAEGWRIHEIAEHFDTSQRTVRRKLERLEHRARAILKVSHAV